MAVMNNKVIKAIKRQFRIQDKLVKFVHRVRKLPEEQRKKVEAMLGGPMDDKKTDALIKKHEKEKQKFYKSLESQLTGK